MRSMATNRSNAKPIESGNSANPAKPVASASTGRLSLPRSTMRWRIQGAMRSPTVNVNSVRPETSNSRDGNDKSSNRSWKKPLN